MRNDNEGDIGFWTVVSFTAAIGLLLLLASHAFSATPVSPAHPGVIACTDGSARAILDVGGHWIERDERREWRAGPLPLSGLCPPVDEADQHRYDKGACISFLAVIWIDPFPAFAGMNR